MEIKLYEDRYRDDMIFMVLQAKDALGRIPSINEDLLDIKKNYFDRGDMFWIAADDNDRVIGCGGYSRIEAGMRGNGITAARVHLGDPPEQWFESYSFYPKHGYAEYEPRYMRKKL